MIWTKEKTTKQNRAKKILSTLISSITVLALIVSLIIFIPDSKTAKGASLFKTWTSYNDFNNNDSATAATTPRTQIILNGSGNPTDAAAGTLTLEPESFTTQASNGSDGDLTVTGATDINAPQSRLNSNEASGSTSIGVYDSTGIVAGDKILIMQTQNRPGTGFSQFSNDTNYMGTEELNVSSVPNSTTINVSPGIQRPNISAQTYAYPIAQAQVIKIMEFDNVTLNNNATLYGTALSYNGNYDGGVISFRANTLTIGSNAKIEMNAKGYMGESSNQIAKGPGRGFTGGGCPRYSAGGGAYGGSGAGGQGGSNGGSSYGTTLIPIMGSGGGRSYYFSCASMGEKTTYPGGNGGGLIKIQAATVNNNGGYIQSNGGSAPGGGGSGGGIFLASNSTIDATKLSVSGGNATGSGELQGGGGSGGRIMLRAPSTGTASIGGGTGFATGGTGDFYNPAFKSPGDLGNTIGLQKDAGSGLKAKWSAVTFNSSVLASGEAIKFAVRTSDDGSSWSAPLGRDGAAIDWTTGTGNYLGQAFGESVYSSISGVSASRYINIVLRLESAGSNTPILNDVGLDYDVLDAPGSGDLSIYRSDGTTQIAGPTESGWTNETSVKVKADSLSGLSDSSTVSLEVEKKNVGDIFDGTGTTTGTAVAYSGSPVSAWTTLSGLTVGQDYHIRLRLKDDLNRVSGWTNFNSNNTAFTVEQTAPTGSVSIDSGAAYATSASVTLDLSSATDPGGSGLDSYMVSEDSTFASASLGDTTWQAYPNSPYTRAFTLSTGDNTKSVYVKYKDKAGNESSSIWSQTDWSGGSGQANWSNATMYSSDDGVNLDNSNAGQLQLNTTANDETVSVNETRTSGDGYTSTITRAWADQVRVTWTWNLYADWDLPPYPKDYAYVHIPATGSYVIGRSGASSGSETTAYYSGNSVRLRYDENECCSGSMTFTSAQFIGTSYNSPATLTSSVKDNGTTDIKYTTLDYTPNSQPSGGSLSVDIRAGNVATPDGTWTAWTTVADAGSLSAYDGNRYIQYKATLTSDGGANTTMTDITVNAQTADSIILDTTGPAAVVEEDGKTSIGFTDATKVTEIADDAWTQDLTPYFSWKANADADLDGAAPYKVYFGTNASATAVVDGAAQVATNYNPGTLTSGTQYYLKTVAKDLAGNYSATSKDYTVKIDDTGPNFTGLSPTASNNWSNRVQVNWSSPSDDSDGIAGGGIDRYEVYWAQRNAETNTPATIDDSSFNEANKYTQYQAPDTVANITNTGFNHYSADGSLTYYYKIKAYDIAGNVSYNTAKTPGDLPTYNLGDMSGVGNVQDTTPPSATGVPSVTAGTFASGTKVQNVLSWAAASDNVGVTGYQIYRSTDALSTMPGAGDSTYTLIDTVGTNSYTDNNSGAGLVDFQEYSYRIRAYDSDTNYGIYSENGITPPTARDTTPDITVPNTPAWATNTGDAGYSATQNNLDWNAPDDPNNQGQTGAGSGISGYNIYRADNSDAGWNGNTNNLGDLPDCSVQTYDVTPVNGGSLETSTSISDTPLLVYTWYAYKIVAYDNAASTNASADSICIWVRTKKETDPVAVKTLSVSTPTDYNSGVGTTAEITFEGGASKSDKLDKYEIYRSTTDYGSNNTLWLANATKVHTFDASVAFSQDAQDRYTLGMKGSPGALPSGMISGNFYNHKDYDDSTPYYYFYNDSGLSDNTTYYYKIRVADYISEESNTFYSWTNSAESTVTIDITAPASPRSVSVYDLYPKGTFSLINTYPMVAIAWEHIPNREGHPTGATDDTFVEYKLYRTTDPLAQTNPELVNWGTSIVASGFTDNYHIDETVASGLTYHYKVTTADGTVGRDNEGSGKVSQPINPSTLDKIAPALISRSENANASSATLNLGFDESSEVVVKLGTSPGSYSRTSGNPLVGSSPTINLRKLTPDTTYYYQVIARDLSNNKLESQEYSFSTPEFVISSVEKSVSVSSATLKWRANAGADSFIKYTNSKTGETRIVANDEETGANVKHSLGLKGLAAGTKYTYTLISKDEYANRATTTGSFTTAKFKATSVAVKTTVSSAIITWRTNVKGDAHVQFGKKSLGEKVEGGFAKASKHSIKLTNLKPGSKYKYRVVSRDADDNIAKSTELMFTTKPFSISRIRVGTSTNSTTITWTTNARSTSSVEYRSASDKVSQLSGDARLTTRHRVVIKNLEDDTSYSYKIKSRDKEDNIAESKGILSFKTNSLEREYNVNPKVSDIDEMELSATSAKIAWTTAGATSSWVDYGTSRSLSKSAGNDTMTVDHIVEITNLTPGTLYYYRVRGEDEAGNKYQSSILTFTALVEPKITEEAKVEESNDSAVITWKTNTDTDSIVEYGLTDKYGDSSGSGALAKEHEVKIEGLAQNTTYHFRIGGVDKYSVKVMSADSTFKTSKDTTGPKIDDIRSETLRSRDAEGKEKISVIVNFTTNEEATSYVEYAEGITMATYNKKTRVNNTLNLSHSALIEGLKPATTYHYRIVTKDRYGNTTKSMDKTILTPKESETVLQKIIKVLEETFSWVSNLRDYLNKKVSSFRK